MNSELDRILSALKTRDEWDEAWDIAKSRFGRFEAILGRNFLVGDVVHFNILTGRSRGRYTGNITKMSTQRGTVKVTSGSEWTVPYSWLELANK